MYNTVVDMYKCNHAKVSDMYRKVSDLHVDLYKRPPQMCGVGAQWLGGVLGARRLAAKVLERRKVLQ